MTIDGLLDKYLILYADMIIKAIEIIIFPKKGKNEGKSSKL